MNVSRETSALFDQFAELVQKWNPTINLVSKSSIADVRERHIADSAQIYDLAPNNFKVWADLGSGGGFPALVIAIIAKERNPSARVVMIESDQRKCEFLRHVSRTLNLNTHVISARIEEAEPVQADVVSARALASLTQLCGFLSRHRAAAGIGLFPKGTSHLDEISAAESEWRMDYTLHPSITAENAVIVQVKDISRAQE